MSVKCENQYDDSKDTTVIQDLKPEELLNKYNHSSISRWLEQSKRNVYIGRAVAMNKSGIIVRETVETKDSNGLTVKKRIERPVISTSIDLNLPRSVFANPMPFVHDTHTTKIESIEHNLRYYYNYVLTTPSILHKLRLLENARLGCFCDIVHENEPLVDWNLEDSSFSFTCSAMILK